jgi:hypothetical protein
VVARRRRACAWQGNLHAPARNRTGDLRIKSCPFAGLLLVISGESVGSDRVVRGHICRVRDVLRDTASWRGADAQSGGQARVVVAHCSGDRPSSSSVKPFARVEIRGRASAALGDSGEEIPRLHRPSVLSAEGRAAVIVGLHFMRRAGRVSPVIPSSWRCPSAAGEKWRIRIGAAPRYSVPISPHRISAMKSTAIEDLGVRRRRRRSARAQVPR